MSKGESRWTHPIVGPDHLAVELHQEAALGLLQRIQRVQGGRREQLAAWGRSSLPTVKVLVHLIDIITVDQRLHDVGPFVSASGYGVGG